MDLLTKASIRDVNERGLAILFETRVAEDARKSRDPQRCCGDEN